MRPCALAHEGCENELADGSKHELCHNCRGRYRDWKEKGREALLAWRGKVRFWGLRLDYLFPGGIKSKAAHKGKPKSNGHRTHTEHRV